MANWMHSGLALVLAAVESTEGTDAVGTGGLPTAASMAHAVYVRSITMNPEWNEVDLQRKRDTYAMTGKLPGKMYWNIEIELPLASSRPTTGSTDIDEPEVIRFLDCAGFKYAVSNTGGFADDTYTITPDSRGEQKTLTIYVLSFKDGENPAANCVEVRRAVACKFGGVELSNSPDGESFWKMSGMGMWQLDGTAMDIVSNMTMDAFDLLGAPEFVHPVDAVVPKSCQIQVPTATDVKPTANFNCSWDSSVESRDDITSPFGCAGFFVQPGVPTLTIDPEFELTSSLDRYTSVYTVEALTLTAQITTINGGVWAFSAPNLQRGAFSFEEGTGTIRVSQALYPRDTAYDPATPGTGLGDDSLEITFTQSATA